MRKPRAPDHFGRLVPQPALLEMLVIPTVDLRNGVCVRPPGPVPDESDFPFGEPLAVARKWASAGFRRLQVIDLDADGSLGVNAVLIEEIVRDGAVEIQAGGGVESIEQIERLAEVGATRVVVGPRALNEPDWIIEAAAIFPGLLIVATAVRERRVVTRGWVRGLPLDIVDYIEGLPGVPLGGLLVTCVGCDAAHAATDLTLLEDLAEISAFPIMAAGGATTMNDLRALEHRGVDAVVLGTALYSGALDARAVAGEFGS